MKRISTTGRKMALMVVLSCLLGVSSASAQGWHFGIGTGLARLNIEGDQGFNLPAIGPVELEIDLDPDQVADLIKTAIGFGGYATNGTWMVQYSFSKIELGGEPGGTLASGETVTSDISFEATTGRATVGYTVYRGGKVALQPYAGVRYLKHDLGADLTIVGATTTNIGTGLDDNWTDVLVGASLNVALAQKVSWNASFDAGFGGSNGTYTFASSIGWRVWRALSLHPNVFFTAHDFENGEKGDSDWYLYDANEFGWGLSFLINF